MECAFQLAFIARLLAVLIQPYSGMCPAVTLTDSQQHMNALPDQPDLAHKWGSVSGPTCVPVRAIDLLLRPRQPRPKRKFLSLALRGFSSYVALYGSCA